MTAHLTTDQFDDLLAGNRSDSTMSHLATCATCNAMVIADRRVVSALEALPVFDPGPGFADRVMIAAAAARPVTVAIPARDRALDARRRMLGAGVLVTGSLAAVCGWASVHPQDALRWSSPLWHGTGHALWHSLQSVVATLTTQTWFDAVRDILATPIRAVAVVAIVAGAYALGLIGLRRVMTEPANAGW